MSTEKEHVSLVIAGTVDAGKSTTTGHLLFKLGGINEREMKKLQEEADAVGKGSFAFAFFMDRTKEERERGITIQCTTDKFYTKSKFYTILDAPGHADYIKNMVRGASAADAALLLVPAAGFISALAKGDTKKGIVQGQSRQHCLLLSTLGIKQLIVGINKMDAKGVEYSQDKYDEIKGEVVRMLKKTGWGRKLDTIPIIPYSGWTGQNLVEESKEMSWWKGTDVQVGKETIHVNTILDALDKMVQPIDKKLDVPFRVPIGSVHSIRGVGDVLTGRVEQGVIEPGTEVVFLPNHTDTNPCVGKVFTVETHHQSVPRAEQGDNVGMNIKGLPKNHGIKPGAVMVKKGDHLRTCKTFTAQVQVLQHPGELTVGYCPVAMVRTKQAPVRLSKINWKREGKVKIEDPHNVKSGDTAEIVFEPTKPMVVEKFKDCEGLGRVAIFEGKNAVMICMVTDVEY